MIKKLFLTAALTFALLPAAAQPEVSSEVLDAPVEQIMPDSSARIVVDEAPSGEVDYEVESAMARTMTQAEKARNAQVNDSTGAAITIIAMTIVLLALVVLSILFLGFGKISSMVLQKKKKEVQSRLSKGEEAAQADVDSGEVIAAIAMALAQHFDSTHDMEETILTIREMKRAYSPWNSKIYNLRELPAIRKNEHPRNAL